MVVGPIGKWTNAAHIVGMDSRSSSDLAQSLIRLEKGNLARVRIMKDHFVKEEIAKVKFGGVL